MNTPTLITVNRPTRTVNFAKILPLFAPASEAGLALARPGPQAIQLAKLGQRPAELMRLRATSRTAATRSKLRGLASKSLSVPQAVGSISRAGGTAALETIGAVELRLPFGMPRSVNAATLKRMLKAKRADVLLRRTGDQWEVCDDSLAVDLLDDSVEFRLGAVQIFS